MIKYIIALIFILLAVVVIVLGLTNFNSRYSDTPDKESYSFLNQFPYEMQDNETMKYSIPFRIIVALFGAAFIAFGFYLFVLHDMYTTVKIIHDYILAGIFVILGISMICPFVLTLRNYRQHLITTSLLFGGTVTLYAYLGYFVFVDPREIFDVSLGYICFVITGGLLAALILTPLKKWMYLEKVEEDGRVTYHRKRLSILPFMEWIFLAADVLVVILLILF